jgi:hypothetical protein
MGVYTSYTQNQQHYHYIKKKLNYMIHVPTYGIRIDRVDKKRLQTTWVEIGRECMLGNQNSGGVSY